MGTFLPGEKAQPVIGERGKLQYEPETSVTVYYEVPKERDILRAMREAHPYEEIAYEVIALQNKYAQTGLGVYGDLHAEMTEEEFLSAAKRIFKTPHIRHSALRDKAIKKIALLGGSGAFGIEAAKAVQADAYITSDLKYHDFFKAEKKILLLDVGHYESERFTKKIIYDYLTKKMSNIATQKKEVKIIISQTETNPVNYY
jgi:putative NIF3 family GTP cyclohydrolase 1 type 2